MNRTLTKEETEHLFKVCENHDVPQYDLQIELVDHLASLVEQHWVEKPEDPFKYAVYKALQKFGPTGFQQVKQQKQRALTRKYNRILWHYLLEFYHWPKTLLTLALTLAVVLLFKIVHQLHWLFAIYILVLVCGNLIYHLRYKSINETTPNSEKSFLLLNQLKHIQYFAMFLCQLPIWANLPFQILEKQSISMPTNFIILFPVAFFIVSSTIVLFAYLFYIPQKIKQHFTQQFPEFVK
ncbi:hypothetical protein SAMN05444285_11266 [Draconibacterium orientale]|jgi:hypothetical protein|uniref:Uncharacterized protein n=1 Tax=Draconibacterium orientale TaxID=1168034 RepID=X5E389_9BACT|nr:hypothetical protein [Draconibacterium orientale]AHW61915.1 hypothetical protein FH5T_10990 [Draconibacterium orientale]SET40879.1 hypothetical protein SAMN05444285_11266 [Draconibacterium orientale]